MQLLIKNVRFWFKEEYAHTRSNVKALHKLRIMQDCKLCTALNRYGAVILVWYTCYGIPLVIHLSMQLLFVFQSGVTSSKNVLSRSMILSMMRSLFARYKRTHKISKRNIGFATFSFGIIHVYSCLHNIFIKHNLQ